MRKAEWGLDSICKRLTTSFTRSGDEFDWLNTYIPGGPIKTEQSIFQDFALINIFLIIITPRSSNLVENLLFYE